MWTNVHHPHSTSVIKYVSTRWDRTHARVRLGTSWVRTNTRVKVCRDWLGVTSFVWYSCLIGSLYEVWVFPYKYTFDPPSQKIKIQKKNGKILYLKIYKVCTIHYPNTSFRVKSISCLRSKNGLLHQNITFHFAKVVFAFTFIPKILFLLLNVALH